MNSTTDARAANAEGAKELVRSTPPLAHVLLVQRELVRCVPPLAHVLRSRQRLVHGQQ